MNKLRHTNGARHSLPFVVLTVLAFLIIFVFGEKLITTFEDSA